MKLNPTYQNILNAVIIIIVIIIAFAIYQTPQIDVHGVFLPQTDQTFQSTNSSAIQVVNNVPVNGQYMGLINTALHYANNKAETISNGKTESLDYTKQLAANAGGDSIIIGYNVPEGPVGPLDSIALRAYVFRTR
ncbi:MAG: hypothetical protein ACJA0H_000382 [Francisellaceae bacterium]|jgi:hypothetical protein